MTLGEIELGKVVVVSLDIRPLGHRKSHIGEDRRQLVDHLTDRMDAADLGSRLARRQGDVDDFRVEALIERKVFQRLLALGDRSADAVLEAVDEGAVLLALGGVIAPSVFNREDIEPWRPNALTRAASSALSLSAFAIAARSSDSSALRSGIRAPGFQGAAGSAALALSTIAWNAAGSRMARSESTLRSTSRPALPRPSMNRL